MPGTGFALALIDVIAFENKELIKRIEIILIETFHIGGPDQVNRTIQTSAISFESNRRTGNIEEVIIDHLNNLVMLFQISNTFEPVGPLSHSNRGHNFLGISGHHIKGPCAHHKTPIICSRIQPSRTCYRITGVHKCGYITKRINQWRTTY